MPLHVRASDYAQPSTEFLTHGTRVHPYDPILQAGEGHGLLELLPNPPNNGSYSQYVNFARLQQPGQSNRAVIEFDDIFIEDYIGALVLKEEKTNRSVIKQRRRCTN
ncbi:hypothetical protein BH23BAC3_BH23BAC3_21460 [soil metagenome]